MLFAAARRTFTLSARKLRARISSSRIEARVSGGRRTNEPEVPSLERQRCRLPLREMTHLETPSPTAIRQRPSEGVGSLRVTNLTATSRFGDRRAMHLRSRHEAIRSSWQSRVSAPVVVDAAASHCHGFQPSRDLGQSRSFSNANHAGRCGVQVASPRCRRTRTRSR